MVSTAAEASFARWASEEGFHGSRRMLSEPQHRFAGQLFAWVPYLYRDLDENSSPLAGIASLYNLRRG
jgi:hypothetical protein